MVDMRIILSGLWVAIMLTYMWGDILRIFSGDAEPGKIFGQEPNQGIWLLISALFIIPILMVVLSLTIPYPAIRWVNIIAAVFLIVLNLFGLPYKGAYDNFLLIVSIVFKALTVWYAWKWVA